MTDDKIAEIRKRHEAGAPGTLPIAALAQAYADRDFLLAKVERQARHIEELREKIDADRSCACSFDAPGDVCAAHSPALMRARAEVERLKLEPETLRAELIAICNASRAALANAYDRARGSRKALEAKP